MDLLDSKSSSSGNFCEEHNNILLEISRTGDVRHNWIVLRSIFAAKIISVRFHSNASTVDHKSAYQIFNIQEADRTNLELKSEFFISVGTTDIFF